MKRSSPPPRATTAEELVRTRDARGLFWSLIARLIFVGIFFLLSALHLLDLIAPGVAAETDFEAYASIAITAAAAAALSYLLQLARNHRRLELAGLGAVALDLVLMSLVVVVWYVDRDTPEGSLTVLVNNELFTLCVPFVVISSLALRPLYPILSAGGFMLLHLALMAFVLSHAAVSPQMDHFHVNPGVTVVRLTVLAMVGAFLAFMASRARRTIYDAVELEVANVEIKERQAEMLLKGKLNAMSGLVAGVAHELNTPLGVVQSGLETSDALVRRLTPLAEGDAKVARSLAATKASAAAALDRMKQVVSSLKGFARLDEAELQRSDVRDGLEATLALIDRDKYRGVEIVKEFSEVPDIECRPQELNQVFMTLIVNALEAMNGQGRLSLETARDYPWVRVAVADTGPGMTPHVLDELFEFRFNEKRGRVGMGLGLPTAYRIVERHGGHLSVESTVGEGTTFTLTFPVDRADTRAEF